MEEARTLYAKRETEMERGAEECSQEGERMMQRRVRAAITLGVQLRVRKQRVTSYGPSEGLKEAKAFASRPTSLLHPSVPH